MRTITIPQFTAIDAVNDAVADGVLANASGRSVDFTSALGNISTLALHDTVVLSGWTDPDADGVYTVTLVRTANEDYKLSKRDGPDPVNQASEAMVLNVYQGMVKIEAVDPELHVLANTGAFSILVRYSVDGVVWFDSGITAIVALGIVPLPGNIVWVRIDVGTIGTDLDVAYVA